MKHYVLGSGFGASDQSEVNTSLVIKELINSWIEWGRHKRKSLYIEVEISAMQEITRVRLEESNEVA